MNRIAINCEKRSLLAGENFTSVVPPFGETLLMVLEQLFSVEELGLATFVTILGQSNVQEKDFLAARWSNLVEGFGQEISNAERTGSWRCSSVRPRCCSCWQQPSPAKKRSDYYTVLLQPSSYGLQQRLIKISK